MYAQNGTFQAKVVVTDNRGNVSAPAASRVIVGTLVDSGAPDNGVDVGSKGTTPRTPTARPGAGSPKLIPGPEMVLVALAAVAVALAGRRHLPR
jgi:hypothetical protein